MNAYTCFCRRILLFLLSLFLTYRCYADTLFVRAGNDLDRGIRLFDKFQILEDSGHIYTYRSVSKRTSDFVAMGNFELKNPTSSFWLLAPLISKLDPNDSEVVLSFSHLTFVEVFLLKGDSLLAHRYAGDFREKKWIAHNDSRFHIRLTIPKGNHYTLLVKVHHTKRYHPNFDFKLQAKEPFYLKSNQRRLIDMWIQGAANILLVYTLLSWLVSRFRPYAWLLLFITGVNLYAISMGGYFVNWFFPNAPETGWLFNIHFMHLGLIGF